MRATRSVLANDPYERRRWNRALRMVADGVPPAAIIRATRVKARTFYYRLAKARAFAEFLAQPPC